MGPSSVIGQPFALFLHHAGGVSDHRGPLASQGTVVPPTGARSYLRRPDLIRPQHDRGREP